MVYKSDKLIKTYDTAANIYLGTAENQEIRKCRKTYIFFKYRNL